MKFKKNIKELIKFRKLVLENQHKEKKSIASILSWRRKLLKKIKIKTKLINVN